MRPARLSDVQMLRRLRSPVDTSVDALTATPSVDSLVSDSDCVSSPCGLTFPPLRRGSDWGSPAISEPPRAHPLPAFATVAAARRRMPSVPPTRPGAAQRGSAVPEATQMSTAALTKQLPTLRQALSLLCPSTDAHRKLRQRLRDFEHEIARRSIITVTAP